MLPIRRLSMLPARAIGLCTAAVLVSCGGATLSPASTAPGAASSSAAQPGPEFNWRFARFRRRAEARRFGQRRTGQTHRCRGGGSAQAPSAEAG